jgi:hypothetical protein
MHLISRPCGGVFCFTVAICPNREVSWGDVRSGFTFYSITRIFEQRIGNRKEERGNRKEGSRPDIGCHIAKERTKLWDDHS